MLDGLIALAQPDTAGLILAGFWGSLGNYALILLGFSLVIFFHEVGHFMAAKACGVRVDKFAVGFGKELFGFTKGETRYSFNALPLGGYVKMLGQEDFTVDKSGELAVKNDPRAFTNKPVGQRMIIVSAGVFMNLVFAAVIFMLVFMIGLKSLPAEIGWLKPGSPAEQVGMRVGDKFVKVNGKSISDQSDLRAAIVLSDPDEPLELVYERKDPATGEVKTETVTLRPEKDVEQNVLQIGVAPPLNTTVAMVLGEDPALPEDQQLKVGDDILEVNGRPVSSFFEFTFALADLRGAFADIDVRRPVPSEGSEGSQEPAFEQRTVKWRAQILFQPQGRFGEASSHLLGLVPRVQLTEVLPGQRAEQGGLQTGDVIVRLGQQLAPRIDEIRASIAQNPETDISVVHLRRRNGKTETLTSMVRPRVRGWFVKSKPSIGVHWQGHEDDELIVADILTKVTDGMETPAASLKDVMPRGSRITGVNGKPVQSWHELAQRFIALAGSEVTLTWTYDGQPEQSGALYVPNTLGTTFELPGSRLITAIDGVRRIEVEINGQRRPFSVDHWRGAREVLKERVGQTITVEYWNQAARKRHTAELTVTPEMIDPWVMRIQYRLDGVITYPARILVRETNPVKAMMIGVRKTYHFIVQVYLTMKRMIFTRSMGLEQISGPVGIIKMGSDLAAAGLPVLMYFLALISANLAVINFLPLPIFDGGLFVFLIIEKIKGQPVSLKVQVATQVIGLALIIGIFLFVTFQDIVRLAGWG